MASDTPKRVTRSSAKAKAQLHENKCSSCGDQRTSHTTQTCPKTRNDNPPEREKLAEDVDIIDEYHLQPFPHEHAPTTDMRADGNCGFRAIAHQVYGNQELWPIVREDLTAAFMENKNGYCNNIKKISGRQITPRKMASTLKAPRGKLAPTEKSLCNELHLQIVSDCYEMAVVTILLTENHPIVEIRIPTDRFKGCDAKTKIKYGIKFKQLEIIGLKFSKVHWDAIDLEGEEIGLYLEKYATLVQSQVGN